MSDYGIKVVKTGADIVSTDIRDLIMSSKYSMLKYHSDTLTFTTINPGDYNAYVEVPHSLGYVPSFIAYWQDTNGKLHYIPGYPYGVDFKNYTYAYATSTAIRCGIQYLDIAGDGGGYNQSISYATGWGNYFCDPYDAISFCSMGQWM